MGEVGRSIKKGRGTQVKKPDEEANGKREGFKRSEESRVGEES